MATPETGLMPLGERIQEALGAETRPADVLPEIRARLLERVTARRKTVSTTSLRFRYAALASVTAVTAILVFSVFRPRPITFRAGVEARVAGDLLEAAPDHRLRVDFSEGSSMVLLSNSRARVLDTAPTGARVLLESGRAEVSIVHRAGEATRWRFEAGPFQVTVTGTEFELGWQPAGQLLSLKMKSGSVDLSGSCLASPRRVEGGGSVRLSCAKAGREVSRTAAPRATAPAPEAAVTAGEASTSLRAVVEPAASARPPTFAERCELATKAELVEWANRERLGGSPGLARTALTVLRQRFPHSSEAATAAFMLGRMAFDQRGDYREAARWFASYLVEQPSGPLRGDAEGRLLEALDRLGNRARARAQAEKYLRQYPDGPYAGPARRILAD